MPKLDSCGDLIQWLGPEIPIKILIDLDDPSDLVRACSVSRLWFRFGVKNALSKELFLKKFPKLSSSAHAFEQNRAIEAVKISGFSYMDQWNYLKRKHRLYSFLAHGLSDVIRKDCISDAISASSSDNYPEETILNTLEVRDRVGTRNSYWSSKGEIDHATPETLLYNLVANWCVVTEIHVQPFQAIRFRVGHLRYPMEWSGESADSSATDHVLTDDMFIWTYTSPEFPMAQENTLQKFKLPEPVI